MEISRSNVNFPLSGRHLFVQLDGKIRCATQTVIAAFEVLSGRPKTPVR